MFAKESIAKGVKFGPYVGKRVPASHVDDDTNTSYMWEVCTVIIRSQNVSVSISNCS